MPAAIRAVCRRWRLGGGGVWWRNYGDWAERSNDGGTREDGYRSDHAAIAASVSLLDGGSRSGMRAGGTCPGTEERDVQRAVLSRTFPASAGDAGGDDHRGTGPGRGCPGVQNREGR